ncbi:MAG: anthranilate synthase component I [Euryarchaeota archaeon]|nr:anthranilate synthase component I [Euryarchaeota archaeon]
MELEEVYEAAGNLDFPCVIPLVKVAKFELKPTDVYAALRKMSKYSFLLESAIVGEKIARYSFLGNSPPKITRLKDGRMNGRKVKNPMKVLRKILKYKTQKNKLPRFSGGLLGYFSYDIVRYFEDVGSSAKDDLKHNDAEFMFVRDLIVFDHWREEVLLISNLLLENERGIERRFRKAQKKISELEKILKEAKPRKLLYSTSQQGQQKFDVRSNFTKQGFEDAVRKTKEYIYAGDIFQAVLSQRFECEVSALPSNDPLSIYLALKEINPSPYMYFLEFDKLKIIGSSPEILVKVDGRKVVVRPIAGTRPRGGNIVEDEQLSREMLNDPKERAEHVMLVDLGRNDVGKVSKFGSVCVDEFMAVEKYSHVQHIVSNVAGELQNGKDAFDALEASFPAGTVSGAPKVRAMQIIEELEPSRRGIYAGSIGYFSFSGDMDFAITIRTIIIQNNKAYIQAGAGIVADSVPEKEYQETVNKGKAMLKAIELSPFVFASQKRGHERRSCLRSC